MFGVLPAYGFYCRHVRGLKFINVQLQTTTSDQRHAVVCEDVEDVPSVAGIILFTNSL